MPSHSVHLVGAHFRPPAKAILQCLPAGAKLELLPEPTNPYDPNAVQVLVQPDQIPLSMLEELDLHARGQGSSAEEIMSAPSWHLGYVARTETGPILSGLDECASYEATLSFNSEGKPKVEVTFTLGKEI